MRYFFWQTSLCLIAIAMSVAVTIDPSRSQAQGEAQAQAIIPSWEEVQSALLTRANSFQTIDMDFRQDTRNSEKSKLRWIEETAKGQEETKKFPLKASQLTPDRVMSYHWVADKSRWLCERTTIYPTDSDHLLKDFARYNGELLFRYDDEHELGEVKAIDIFPGFYGAINSNPHIGLLDYIQALCGERKDEVIFTFKNQQVINHEECLTYVGLSKQAVKGEGRLSRITISVSPKRNYALVKLLDETYLPDVSNKTTHNGSAMLYIAEDFKEASKGLFVPMSSNLESYRIYQNKTIWRTTDVYSVSNIDVNTKLSAGIFNRDFPPGIRIKNDVSSPGVLIYKGGDWHEVVGKISSAQSPPGEIKDGTTLPPL